jgi:hypothetical protein
VPTTNGSGVPDALVALAEAVTVRSLLRDLVVVAAWVLLAAFAFRAAGWPSWPYPLVALGGVVAYSLATDP